MTWVLFVQDELKGNVRLEDEEILEMCRYVREMDAAGAASFRFKLLIGLGRGYLDPIMEVRVPT